MPRWIEPHNDIDDILAKDLTLIADGWLSTEGTLRANDTSALCEALKNSTKEPVLFPDDITPVQLPEDLRICLEIIENDLLEGHLRLSEALKRRYEEQLPLIQSLEDILVDRVRSLSLLFIHRCSIMCKSPPS